MEKLPGNPDIVFVNRKIAVFVDGCFWHKCPQCYIELKSNRGYCLKKIDKNVKRDKKINELLKKTGWKVIRLREHQLKENFNETFEAWKRNSLIHISTKHVLKPC